MADGPAFIYRTLREVGFGTASAIIGTAIVLAESGGNRSASGDGGSSLGWWQIHLPAHPDVTSACALDPVCSSRAALRISNGGRSFTPWSVFTSGAYLVRLPAARAAAGAAVSPDRKVIKFESCVVGDAPGLRPVYSDGSRGPCTAISPDPAVQSLGDFSPWDLVKRIAVGALGAALLLLGLLMVSSDVTLSTAARRFGAEIGKATRRAS